MLMKWKNIYLFFFIGEPWNIGFSGREEEFVAQLGKTRQAEIQVGKPERVMHGQSCLAELVIAPIGCN